MGEGAERMEMKHKICFIIVRWIEKVRTLTVEEEEKKEKRKKKESPS